MNVETLQLEPVKEAETEVVDHEAMMPGWIARVRAGDQLAARALVERLRPGVLRIVRARRPRRVAEEDLTQEVFMKMFARLGQYQGSAPFTHWVSRIAVTTCLDHWRAQQRRPELRWADLAEWETDRLDERADERSARTAGEALESVRFQGKPFLRL